MRAFLASEAGAEMLQDILKGMMAEQGNAAPKRPARASRSRAKAKQDEASRTTAGEAAA